MFLTNNNFQIFVFQLYALCQEKNNLFFSTAPKNISEFVQKL